MPLAQVKCPSCAVVLKPATPIPEGRKIKCPKCSKVFVADASVVPRTSALGPGQDAARKPSKLDPSQSKRMTTTGGKLKTNPIVILGICFVVCFLFTVIPYLAVRTMVEPMVQQLFGGDLKSLGGGSPDANP